MLRFGRALLAGRALQLLAFGFIYDFCGVHKGWTECIPFAPLLSLVRCAWNRCQRYKGITTSRSTHAGFPIDSKPAPAGAGSNLENQLQRELKLPGVLGARDLAECGRAEDPVWDVEVRVIQDVISLGAEL